VVIFEESYIIEAMHSVFIANSNPFFIKLFSLSFRSNL